MSADTIIQVGDSVTYVEDATNKIYTVKRVFIDTYTGYDLTPDRYLTVTEERDGPSLINLDRTNYEIENNGSLMIVREDTWETKLNKVVESLPKVVNKRKVVKKGNYAAAAAAAAAAADAGNAVAGGKKQKSRKNMSYKKKKTKKSVLIKKIPKKTRRN
jgi:hypothetical protein